MKVFRSFFVAAVFAMGLTVALSACGKDEENTEQGEDANGNKESGKEEKGKEESESVGGDDNNGGGDSNGGAVVVAGHEYIDLGLESGTLWATCNIGADSMEEDGYYFAWGETEAKETYTQQNCKFYAVSFETMRKDGVFDENDYFTAEYDAATAKWGSDWRIPTSEELRELCALESELAEVKGVKGRYIIGKNGNRLFFPFCGFRRGENLLSKGKYGNYSSQHSNYGGTEVSYMNVGSEKAGMALGARKDGYVIRAVLRSK